MKRFVTVHLSPLAPGPNALSFVKICNYSYARPWGRWGEGGGENVAYTDTTVSRSHAELNANSVHSFLYL